jgi:4-hydroxy-3-methylbut-2-enyl diphosphate reductase
MGGTALSHNARGLKAWGQDRAPASLVRPLPTMPFMVDRVLLAQPRGFCAGVEMAIKALTWMVRVFDPPVYCYHQIVHNAQVVAAFQAAGVVFVDDVGEVPVGAPLMLSAHGSAPAVLEAAQSRAAVVVDAVCPLVAKVHHGVRQMAADGYQIVYLGHEGHDEAVGTVAQAPCAVTLVAPEAGLGGFVPADPRRVAVVVQTTMGMQEWRGVLDEATGRFPGLRTARKGDLCYATTNRQAAVEVLARRADVVLVVGSRNSSNTRALVQVARGAGGVAHRVDDAASITPGLLGEGAVVGVTAGASAPEQSVRAVIDALAPRCGVEVVSVGSEDEYFPPPPQLRALLSVLQDTIDGGFTARRASGCAAIDDDRSWTAAVALDLLPPAS